MDGSLHTPDDLHNISSTFKTEVILFLKPPSNSRHKQSVGYTVLMEDLL